LPAEHELAQALLAQLRPDFAEREASAQKFAELLLDAVDAALPLTRHGPAELSLPQLEELGQQVDVFDWESAPGWDEVLARGLLNRHPLPPGGPLIDGVGAFGDRTQQRGELKRRAHAEATLLVERGRAREMVASHASILRLVGLAAAFGPLQLAPAQEAGELPARRLEELLREMDERGDGFALAQEEWLALLLERNPAAAAEPQFRTFFAGLSHSLRAARALRDGAHDLSAMLGAVVSWQPQRWPRLHGGAKTEWISELLPATDVNSAGEAGSSGQLRRERAEALALLSRLWFAQGASLPALYTLAALFTARCASAAALCEELANDARAG
jgi:hypothetical protein